MARKANWDNMDKLLDEKNRLSKEHPSFTQAYQQFLQDWERYSDSQQALNKTGELSDYLIFGASPQEQQ